MKDKEMTYSTYWICDECAKARNIPQPPWFDGYRNYFYCGFCKEPRMVFENRSRDKK